MASYNIPNPPTFLGMDNFRGLAEGQFGIARANRFIARITPVGRFMAPYNDIMRELSYLCEVTEFPGRSFTTAELRYYGPSFKMPVNTGYEDLHMTFICRAESFERQFFDDWMTIVNPTDSYDFNYRDDYRAQVELFHFTDYSEDGKNPKVEYSFTIDDAYPVLVNAQPMTWADDQFLRLGVTLSYRRWRRDNRDPLPRNGGTGNASFSLI